MPIGPGSRIGPYEITALIGEGGMGKVWRARHTGLKRDDALKVLPDAFAADPERLARFRREAQVLASLNHPNIAHVHGLEQSDGVQALVMELVEGPTLGDRIAQGPIPLDEALPIAKQIAEALEAAHEQGIIHRDLKPANIKLRPDGVVKVLDFGLAKALEPASSASMNATASPTITSPAMTGVGVLLGTAAYMSPEQAKGKAVDKRSDIWAFGCVLYEMLTGKRAFDGEDVSETLAAVLRSEPDLTRVPLKLGGLVRACLERDPRRRLRDIGDAPRLITDDVSASRPNRVAWIATAGLGALLAVAIVSTIWLHERPADRSLVRLDVDLGVNAVPFGTNDVLISPDATRVVFSIRSEAGRPPQLATRRLDTSVVTPLPGTDGARLPFFSPDSQWIGFFAARKLHKIPVQGGVPVALADAPSFLGASWGDDGYIVAGIDRSRGLVRIPESGGDPQPLSQLESGEVHALPHVLPGARAVVFTATTLASSSLVNSSIEAIVVGNRQRKTLVDRGYFGQYVAPTESTGYLLYVNDGALIARRFEPVSLELQSEPATLIEGLGARDVLQAGSFSISHTGTFVYTSDQGSSTTTHVVWLDASGKTAPLLSKPGTYLNPFLSPDNQRLAVTVVSDRGRDIWAYEHARDIMTRLTYDGNSQNTVWAPAGRHLLYWRPTSAGYSIVYARADGAGEPIVLLESKNVVVPTSFSPDRRRLLYFELDPETRQDVWTLPLDFTDVEHPKPGKPEPFLRTRLLEFEPSFSPDGRWVAYRAGEGTGGTPIFVRPYPGPGGQWQISPGDGADRNPMWSPDGKQLFYVGGDSRIMAVDYTTSGDSFVASKPRVWADYRTLGVGAAWDVSLAPDGKRFVVLEPVTTTNEGGGSVRATFLLNFFDELRRRVPGE